MEIHVSLTEGLAHNLLSDSTTMKTGDSLKTTMLIRSQKTGVPLPRQGTFVRDIENLGRKLILVDFASAGEEYLFPTEVLDEHATAKCSFETTSVKKTQGEVANYELSALPKIYCS
jgi:hypothetical protein